MSENLPACGMVSGRPRGAAAGGLAGVGLRGGSLVAAALLCITPGWAVPVKAAAAAHPAGAAAAGPARAIAARVVAAYGGPERLQDLKNLAYRKRATHSVISGVSSAQNNLVCDITGRGDRVRVETRLLGQQMIMGFNGKQSWTQFGDWVSPSSPTVVKQIVEEIAHGLNMLADLAVPGHKVDYLGSRTAAGKSCDVIRVYTGDGKPTTLYVDQASHLVVRSEYLGVDQEQGVPATQAVEYADYRPLAGSMVPFKTVEYTAGKRTSQTVLDDFQCGIAVDDTIFDMPPESFVARVRQGPVEVPFDYLANEMLVKVRIKGNEYKFIVDTGASQTVVDKSIAGSIGEVSAGDFSITAGSTALPLSYMTLPDLTIGDITLSNLAALVTDLSSFKAALGERPDGLIGANVLRRFLVTFDPEKTTVILSDPRKVSVPPGAVVVKTSPVYGATALVVPGRLDNKVNLNFLVDTGAAFNNLPQSTVRALSPGPTLPVGLIFGVDGKKQSISALRLKRLSLGSLAVADPVFALTPQASAGGGATGLFSAGSMGILGNPFWRHYRMTIDYRNERLFLEPSPGMQRVAAAAAALNAAAREFYARGDIERARSACQSVIQSGLASGDNAVQALGLARLAEFYAEKGRDTRSATFTALASREYSRAASLAGETSNKEVAAHVLALWAGYQLSVATGSPQMIAVSSLLTRALKLSSSEPEAYVVMGSLFLRTGKLDLARRYLDQALMLDPANWTALWAEYRLYARQNKPAMQKLVLAQLNRYYPGAAEVKSACRTQKTGQ